jgi:predicted metal-dependent hydrolase
MNHTNQYKNYNLKVVINKKLKHSYISIDKNKNILLKTPYESQAFIDSLLEEKSSWIEKQFLKLEKINLIPNEPRCTKDFLRDRVEYFAQEMRLDFKELKFRKMKSRWGSCTSDKVITLNSELTKLKCELIDYVVVHELSHLVHMNHSREFHAFVEKYLPGSKSFKKELQRIRLS